MLHLISKTISIYQRRIFEICYRQTDRKKDTQSAIQISDILFRFIIARSQVKPCRELHWYKSLSDCPSMCHTPVCCQTAECIVKLFEAVLLDDVFRLRRNSSSIDPLISSRQRVKGLRTTSEPCISCFNDVHVCMKQSRHPPTYM